MNGLLNKKKYKRLATEFDADKNIVSIIDTNVDSEIFDSIFQDINDINHSALMELKEELKQNFYHPFDRNATLEYLKRFIRKLSSESQFVDDENDEQTLFYNKYILKNMPVLFLRKKHSGVITAIDSIIEDISKNEHLSGPLINIVGGNEIETPPPIPEQTIEKILASLGREDQEILLSQVANKEQLEIAQKIDRYNAVLVQGPPGKGKTHTITNLVGHLLSQGKSILVTSHTTKALSVLKEKIHPELQNLAVSVLGENNKDMEKSVDGISDYISRNSSEDLFQKINSFKDKRTKIILELDNLRKSIYDIKHSENKTIVMYGMDYSPTEAAKYVYENHSLLSYIPGKIALYEPLPLTESELQFLYKTNITITEAEENELLLHLPNPNELLTPSEFDDLTVRKKLCK